MFTSITGKEGFEYQFEKICNAIADQSQGNIHAAIRLGLDTLQGFFNGNPRGLSERDARILGRAFLL
ncbi:hypothetical protein ACNSO7_19460, partial [Yersinia enterocolitica]